MSIIREPVAAGLFYPNLRATLSQTVDELLLRAASRPIKGTLRALIVPHAGFTYSGYTAAVAYKLLKGASFETVVVVGPSHREYFDGVSVYRGDAYETPLGQVAVDVDLRERIAREEPLITISEEGHTTEHSVEVQLPFLQRVLSSFSFVPIIMGDQKQEYCNRLAQALARACVGRNILLVASSDLSHYHPYKEAIELDRTVLEGIGQYDDAGLLKRIENQDSEACGGGPLVVVMKAARLLGADVSQVLFYCNSGDVTGEKDAVVGYVSAALTQGT